MFPVAKPGSPATRALAVTVKRPPNKSITLRLVPWGEERDASGNATTVWVLSTRDRAAASRLRQREESFVELRGTVHLVLPWLLVDREGLKPPRIIATPATANPFSDRNSLVLRLLLDDPDRAGGIRELATEAGVSPGTASKVLRRLAMEGLADAPAGKQPVRLGDPQQLLRRWARAYDWQRNESRAFHAPIGDPQRFLRRLPGILGSARWRLTMHAGASLVAPHAAWDRSRCSPRRRTSRFSSGEFIRSWACGGDPTHASDRPSSVGANPAALPQAPLPRDLPPRRNRPPSDGTFRLSSRSHARACWQAARRGAKSLATPSQSYRTPPQP